MPKPQPVTEKAQNREDSDAALIIGGVFFLGAAAGVAAGIAGALRNKNQRVRTNETKGTSSNLSKPKPR
jgi:hypothetical protein